MCIDWNAMTPGFKAVDTRLTKVNWHDPRAPSPCTATRVQHVLQNYVVRKLNSNSCGAHLYSTSCSFRPFPFRSRPRVRYSEKSRKVKWCSGKEMTIELTTATTSDSSVGTAMNFSLKSKRSFLPKRSKAAVRRNGPSDEPSASTG